MARILKVNVSQLEGRNLLDSEESTILPNGTIAAYRDPDSNKYKLGIHNGINVLPDFLLSESSDILDILEKAGEDTNIRANSVLNIITNIENTDDLHTWTFMSDGTTYLPYNTADAENPVTYLSTANNVSNVNLEVEATKDVYLVADSRGTPSKWKFDTAGNITLPSGGDILDSTGTSVLGASVDLTGLSRIVSVPNSSTGAPGDKAGDIATDETYAYFCTQDYIENLTTVSVIFGGNSNPGGISVSSPVAPQVGWNIYYDGNVGEITQAVQQVSNYVILWTPSFEIPTGAEGVQIGPQSEQDIWKKVELKELDNNGEITFPDGTVQSTAYAGGTGHALMIDTNRTDTYIEVGSSDRPFKTFAAAIAAADGVDDKKFTFVLMGCEVTEDIDFTGTDFEQITIATTCRSTITGNITIADIPGLSQLVVRNIEVGGTFTLTGDGTSEQMNNCSFYNVSFSGAVNITATNATAFYEAAFFGAVNFNNLSYLYINGAQFTADWTITADSTGVIPSRGINPGTGGSIAIVLGVIANNLIFVKGGTAAYVFQPHNSRIGLNAGTYTIPSGWTVTPHSSVLRGTWTNGGTLQLRNTSHDNAIAGTAPVYTGSIGAASVKFADGTTQTTAALPASESPSKTTGSWTLEPGVNTRSFTVDWNNTYVMWVRGNIPNGIIAWNATISVTNANVPIIGSQYAWNYNSGTTETPVYVLQLTSIPSQIIGTQGAISTALPAVGTEANTLSFTINNASGSVQTIQYGYTKV
jgi:hypothetical protein